MGETASKEIENSIEAEQEVAEGLGEFYGPFPVDALKERAENAACVYVLYDKLRRPVRIGQTGNLRQRFEDYKDRLWFREPMVSEFAYVVVEDEQLRRRIEKIMIKLVASYALFNVQHAI